ncbi:Hint domain-containing protein [Streptomyces sp. NPDC087845]|uniref:Hint domain-containing protein n=2 Tax=Streptomyces TaxID=1883 RepID=UPI003823C2E6
MTSEEGCSASGAAKATAVGAVTGGVFGAAASRFGRKSTTQPEPDGQPSSPRPGGCRVPGVPHSFTGTTTVLMADHTTKPISQVKVGDYVLTAEPGKKKKEKHKVKAVIVTKTDRNYVDVVVDTKSGPKTIQTTKHHQFYESTKDAWTQASDLKAGQKLQNASGGPTVVLDAKAYTAHRTTYDLSIDGLHTYYVLAGATPVLVHNCNVDPQSAPGGKNGAAVSIKQVKMALGRADMSVSQYDIVHVPEIRTAGDGLPAYANSPHDGNGMPNLGPRGRPVIQISNMGLADMDTAVATIFHETYHHRMYATWPGSMGGTESAAETFGQAMLGVFRRRTGS